LEKRSKKYYNVDADGLDLIVRDENEEIVSDPFTTKYHLCSARCARKEHFGTFEDNVFTCNFFEVENTYPLEILGESLKKREFKMMVKGRIYIDPIDTEFKDTDKYRKTGFLEQHVIQLIKNHEISFHVDYAEEINK